MKRRQPLSTPIQALLLLTLSILTAFSALKGYGWGIQIVTPASWTVNYDYGLIRRGLVGSVFRWLVTLDEHTRDKIILLAYGSTTLIGLCLIHMYKRIVNRFGLQGAIGVLAFVASPFLSHLVYNNGTHDSIVAILLFIITILAKRQHFVACIFIIAIGMQIHEMVMLFGAPLLLFAAMVKKDTKSPFIGFQLILNLHWLTIAALILLMTSIWMYVIAVPFSTAYYPTWLMLGVPASFLPDLVKMSVQSGTLARMQDIWMTYPYNGLLGMAFCLMGPVIMLALFRPRQRLMQWLIAVLPLTTALVAWDLSRLCAYAGYLLLLTLFIQAEDEKCEVHQEYLKNPMTDISRTAEIATATLTIALLLHLIFTPFIGFYFHSAGIYNREFFKYQAGKRFADGFIELYNSLPQHKK